MYAGHPSGMGGSDSRSAAVQRPLCRYIAALGRAVGALARTDGKPCLDYRSAFRHSFRSAAGLAGAIGTAFRLDEPTVAHRHRPWRTASADPLSTVSGLQTAPHLEARRFFVAIFLCVVPRQLKISQPPDLPHLVPRYPASPKHLVVPDDVMGLASLAPVSDRWS